MMRYFLLLCVVMISAGCIPDETHSLSGTWRVEDIDQGGVTDNSMLTIQFAEQDRIAGSTGCNQYHAMLNSHDHAFEVSKAVTTRRACVPAISHQEQRFLAALNDAARYEIEQDTWLIIYDKNDKKRLKLIQIEPEKL